MNNDKTLSMQELKIQHLSVQSEHLQFVKDYHLWLAAAATDPALSKLHRMLGDQIDEAMKHLGQIINVLLRATPPVKTTQSSIPSYEETLTSD